MKKTTMDWYLLAAASTDTMEDYTAADFCDGLDNFFTFEMRKNHPQIPFYDTPQGAIFGGIPHKKVQMKRRILEYHAKY